MLKYFEAIVLCDFDGTTVEQDVLDDILNTFGESPNGPIGKAFDEGVISHQEMNEGFAKSLKCTPTELKIFLENTIRIRDGFYNFYASLAARNIGFAVISSGWDLYISIILKDYDLYLASNISDMVGSLSDECKLVVVCNEVHHNGNAFCYTSHELESRECAPNKALIATYLKKSFHVPIIYIGDGSSDYEIAKTADFVFATGHLSNYCLKNDISYLPFETFQDVEESLIKVLGKLRNTRNKKPRTILSKDF